MKIFKQQHTLMLSIVLIIIDIFLLAPLSWMIVNRFQPPVVASHKDVLIACFLLLRNAVLYSTEFAFAYLILYRKGIPWREIGLKFPSDRSETYLLFTLALLSIVVIVVVNMLWAALFLALFHTPVSSDDQFVLYALPLSHSALIFLLLFAAPVCEEIIFRGLIQGWLLRVYATSPYIAIIGTALLFAAGHLDLSHFDSYFLSGLVLGYLAYRTCSLLPGMLWHALFNLLFVFSFLFAR